MEIYKDLEDSGEVSIIKFDKTLINLSGLSTKTISEPKIQETSTIDILSCIREKNLNVDHNCQKTEDIN